MDSNQLRDRFRGTIVGQALGDACGFPLEGLPPWRCVEQAELAVSGRLSRGEAGISFVQYTDDTQMALALAESLVERRKVDPADVARRFAALWSEGRIVGQGMACRSAAMLLLNGAPWDEAGAPEGRAGNGAAMRAAPVGLFCRADPEALFDAADRTARITHRDARARAGAVVVASAVAHLVEGGPADARSLVERTAPQAARLYPPFADLLGELPDRIQAEQDGREPAAAWFTTAGYTDAEPGDWQGVSPYVIPTVLCAFWACSRQPDDHTSAIRLAIECGGDVDTTAAITGALVGSRVGLSGLPRDLVRQVHDREHTKFDDLLALADRLTEVA